MDGLKRRLLGLCLPPLLLCLLDNTLTLVGQSAQYWAGNYLRANEGSPTFHQLLQTHPAAFIAGSAIWAMVFVGGILLLPDTLALIASIAITFGHTIGVATWLLYRFHCGYQLCNSLVLLSATLVGVGIRWGWRARPEPEYRLWKLPSLVRGGLAGLLLGVGMYVYLWPRNSADTNVAGNDVVSSAADAATASTDRELEELGRMPQLTSASLSGAEITSAGLARLEGLAQLQVLTLCGLRVTGVGLEHLERLSKLKWLVFSGVSIPDADLRHLAGLTQLQNIVLSGPQVTDAWLEPLKGLTQLQVLYLDGAKITDAGLPYLTGLTRLKLVRLGRTNCTLEGRRKFQQALPNCKVEQ
jgi:hypothetical protein